MAFCTDPPVPPDSNIGYLDLTSLQPGVFDSLTKLTTLELENNALSTLPPGVFDSLAELTNL